MKRLLQRIRRILHDRRTRRILTRFVSVTAAIIVFVTTYALVLPAITMELQAQCGIEAHQHDDSCYSEKLVCGEAESPDHHHTDACYEKALTCEKEVHVHSAACYQTDPVEESAVAASTSSTFTASAASAMEMSSSADSAAGTAGTASPSADNEDSTDEGVDYGFENVGDGLTETPAAAMTDADSNAGYIPQLDPLDFNTVLNSRTGIYYHPVADGEVIEDSTLVPADGWIRIPNTSEHNTSEHENNVTLGRNDLLQVYLAYTIPAGALNSSNPAARYRLPGNIHLTDTRVKAINETVNGIAGQYVDMSTLEILDTEKYESCLGIEAVEGDRRPDESVEDYFRDHPELNGSEYVSATVKVENIRSADGDYEGQDLVFTFTPYSIEKNQHEYDSNGQPARAGKEISGWLTLDFNVGQVDWNEEAVDTSESKAEDRSAIDTELVGRREQTADIVFVEEGLDQNDHKIDGISTTLKLVRDTVAEGRDDTEDDQEDKTADQETAENEQKSTDKTVSDGKAGEGLEEAAESNTGAAAEQSGRTGAGVTKEKDITAAPAMPAVSFNDKITVSTGRPKDLDENAGGTVANAAGTLPKKAKITVRVEADEGTFPAGTTMVLKAVDDLDAVAEAVTETVENKATESTDETKPAGETESIDETESVDEKESSSGERTEKEKPDQSDKQQETENNEAKDKKNLKTYGFQAVDITFIDAEGNEIEPAKPVRVALTSATVEQVKEEAKTSAVADPVVVHVDDDGNAEQMELVDPEEIEPARGKTEEELLEENQSGHDRQNTEHNTEQNTEKNEGGTSAEAELVNDNSDRETEKSEAAGTAATVGFQADSFSVYAIVYTVDFHYDVDGKTYDFSIKGSDSTGLSELLPILNIIKDDESTKVNEIRTFINDIEDVRFSDESFVKVIQITEDTTAGRLKEKIKEETGEEPEYSGDLTEEELAEMDAKEFKAVDWALISMKSFESEESLTVTMKSGEVFTVVVTDDQINNTGNITSGNNYYIYTVSDGTAYALSYDGSTSVVDVNNPTLGDDYNWKFTKPDNYWIIQNVGHDDHYLDLKSGKIASQSATGISIVDRQDYNAGFSMMNWENNGWVYLALNKNNTPYTYTTTASSSSASRMRLLDAPAAPTQTDDPGDDPVIIPTSPIPNTVDPPTGSKALVPNTYDGQEDGTYTLSLSVTPHSNPEGNESKKKANVLIVMDRSSSMITRTVDDNTVRWYYGNTSSATFRGDIRSGTGYTFYDANGTRLYENNYWAYGNWGNYTLHYSNGQQYTGDVWVESKTTRLKAEQDALNGAEGLFHTLLANNTVSGNEPDTVEIKVISFADERYDDKSFKSETESSSWVSGNNASDLESVVSSSRFTSGTNWEEALQYAWDEIKAKKDADGNKEEYYVIFLTDGEPTAKEGNEPNQAPYSQGDDPVNGNIVAYDAAKDDAKKLVDNGIKFYNIFTFRKDEKIKYSIYLTNYAYGNGDHNEDSTTDAAKNYFSDAKTITQLNDKFKDIIASINTVVGHANVVITDMLTTDALTSTTVEGKAGGFVYSVKDKNGIPLYTVTASDNTEDPNHPLVTFHVPNPQTNGTDDYPATEKTKDGRTYYEAEIDENTTYKMALAEFTNTEGEKTGKIEWDLSALGMLLGGYTYTVSFVVWPDQDAYDYVAALNNKIPSITNSKDETVTVEWDEDNQEIVYEEDGTTIKYYKNGVPEYPSIVKYPNGVFAVLTNTEQKVKYSVIKTETVNGEPQPPVISDPIEFELPTPDPMPLTSTGSRVSKVWNVNRDPDILIKLLYEFNVDGTLVKDSNGNPVPKAVYAFDEDGEPLYDEEENPIKIADGFFVDFIVQQDDSEYKTVRLGWDDEKKEYVWYVPEETDEEEIAKYTKTVTYGEGGDAVTFTIGTKWEQDFSIATGLMLTYDRMVAIGLDPDSGSYPQGEYEDEDGTIKTYYLLEDGHDYTLTEPGLGYEYDFSAPTYHPMLVDGVMKSVLFTKSDDGKTITISEINDMEISKDKKSMLDVANTLRGYIHLNKVIVEKDGTTLDTADTTEFEYFIELFNDNAPFTEEGNHIPWYGISGLFYHDEEGNYYQAYAIRDETGRPTRNLTLTDEKGVTFSAETSSGDPFNEDVYGPTKITILIDEDTGETKEIDLYGNQMTPDEETAAAEGEYRKAAAVFKITQNQTLNIANVPVNTSYTIIESHKRGYELIKIEKIIQQKKGSDKHETLDDVSTATISGKIVSDRDNNIIYTNKKLPDLEIIKVDSLSMNMETKNYLEGAEFTVTQLNETGTGQYKQAETGDETEDGDESGQSDENDETDEIGGSEGTGETGESGQSEETKPKLYYQKVVTSDADGKILITDLEPGYYEIKEIKAPDGYVVTAKSEYIKLVNGIITRISKADDNPETTDVNEGLVENWPSKSNSNTELIQFTPGTNAVADDPETEDVDESKPPTNDTFLIGNEPGAELPSAGGHGTDLIYLLGIILTGIAGAGMITKRRRETA